ncbi:MAG TPA: peptidylprolyl isomerase [Steroidobacteraceae bacterium]|nr:peptidylprolyl isomerase [Steroidobacteraceae bacterium]
MPTPRAAAHRRPTGIRSLLAGCLLVVLPGFVAAAPAPAAPPAPAETTGSRVRIDTTLGSFTVLVDSVRAPLTTANFLAYVASGQYSGTLFHRVISNFVVQGGGYDEKYKLKDTKAPVPNESGNGLSNKRGTVGLARSEAPHSGNAQFYVNLTDNEDLDPTPLRWGYAIFGRVVEGMDVVDRIGRTPTGPVGPWAKDAPIEPVIIKRIEVIAEPAASARAPVAATPAASTAAPATASPAAPPTAPPGAPPVGQSDAQPAAAPAPK